MLGEALQKLKGTIRRVFIHRNHFCHAGLIQNHAQHVFLRAALIENRHKH